MDEMQPEAGIFKGEFLRLIDASRPVIDGCRPATTGVATLVPSQLE